MAVVSIALVFVSGWLARSAWLCHQHQDLDWVTWTLTAMAGGCLGLGVLLVG